MEAAQRGDATALELFDRLGRNLGVGIAGFVNIFQPQRVAIGGGLSRAHELFLERAIEEAGRRALPRLWERTEVRLAQGGAAAGLIGAGVLARQEFGDTDSHELKRRRVAATAEQGTDIQKLAIDTIRTLSIDGVQKANSGHPGAPMALAPVAYQLYAHTMKHNPANPHWFDRDRFVLSAGHASMLLYSILHLSGYGVSMDDLMNFRQLLSPTAGHPEHEAEGTPGVEVTTGPLGQGVGNAVGFALAERMLAARFNRKGHEIVDHHTYAIASDGDMQEGVASEASSLAGHLGLGRLTVFYDDNHIQLAGPTSMGFSEDVGRPLRGLRLARAEPGRGHLDRQARQGDREGPHGRRAAVAGHPAHPHRLRLAQQAGHPEGTRLAAGRGRGAPDQGGLRLGPRRALPGARRGARALRAGGRARPGGRGRLEGQARELPQRVIPRRPRRSSR